MEQRGNFVCQRGVPDLELDDGVAGAGGVFKAVAVDGGNRPEIGVDRNRCWRLLAREPGGEGQAGALGGEV